MNKIFLMGFIISLFFLSSCSKNEDGKFYDKRDGTTYKTFKIGNTEWLGENLKYKCEGSFAYDNNESNVEKYGRLYTWDAARTASPSGWHLPSDEEWKHLIDNLPKDSTRAKLNPGGTVGFNAILGGTMQPSGNFYLLNTYGAYWCTKEDNVNFAWMRFLKTDTNSFGRGSMDKQTGLSVRCVRDY